MSMKVLFAHGAIVAAFLGLPNIMLGTATLDQSDQGYDKALRLPFHEAVGCLNASDTDVLATGMVEMAIELDKYLHESLVLYDYLRVEDFNITSYNLLPTNNSETARSFLRQQTTDKKTSLCELNLEITGVAFFAIDSTSNHSPSTKAPVPLAVSFAPDRSMIYSRVATSLAENHGRLTAIEMSKTTPSVDDRRTLQTCVSIVKVVYSFSPGEFMCSENGAFFFGLGDDGDLGIWQGFSKVWSAGILGEGTRMVLQPDGNLVVRDRNNIVLWNSRTNGAVDSGGEVQVADNGEVSVINRVAGKTLSIVPTLDDLEVCATKLESISLLLPGERICSQDAMYSFGLTVDGDLGIFFGPKQLWSAGTCCRGDGTLAQLQADGNFVIRSGSGDALWESSTKGIEGSNSIVTVNSSGVVSIINLNAGKSVTIEPLGGIKPLVEEVPVNSSSDSCVQQGPGRFELQLGEFICSSNGSYRFGVDASGDLKLFDGTNVIWSAGTCCAQHGVYAILQKSDGNFVVRNSNSKFLWSSATGAAKNANSSLSLSDSGTVAITNPSGKRVWALTPHPTCLDQKVGSLILLKGQFICSSNERFRFGVVDGDISLWDGESLVWSLGLSYQSLGVYMQMQSDGNLVVRNKNGDALWSSKTSGNSGSSLNLDENGFAKILSSDGTVLWTVSGAVSGPSATPFPPTLSPTPHPSSLSPTPPIPAPTPSLPSLSPTVQPTVQPPPVDPSLLPCLDPIQGRVVLTLGDFFCSPNGRFKFGLALDGDLALLEGSRKIWTAGTSHTGEEVTASLQVDGNLIVKTLVSDQIVWTSQSATLDTNVTSLIVGDDGIVTITDMVLGHIWSSAITSESDRVVPDSLVGKVMAGYQGWFFADGDGGIDQWVHWSRPREVPSKNSITIDAWPDLRELDDDELYPTELTYKDGSNAGLYSAYNAKTVERHTRWMKDYGVHGVFVQRFIGNVKTPKWRAIVNKVLANVRSGAEKYGRTFVNMYDIGNGDEATIVEDVINDWKHLVDDENITKSRQYLYHRGRPLVAIWGFGFYDRLGNPHQVTEIIDWFQNKAEDKYKATVMGGVPAGWRDLSRDSKNSTQWAAVYRSFDVISPWAVGRIADVGSANLQRARYIEPDLVECASLGIDYLPVVFPGFSWKNLKPLKAFNEIPRDGGRFMWHQMHNAVAAGSKMIYVAMFDEVDEATAIFKIADNQQQTPAQGRFLSADTDGFSNCPGDWYLNITGIVAGLVEKGKDVPLNMPAYPQGDEF